MQNHSPSEKILVRLMLEKFDQIVDVVEQLPTELANAKPGINGGNSPIQILIHCCGMMRRWSSTVNLGITIPRDRTGEFEVVLPRAQALIQASQAREAFESDLRLTDMQARPVALPADRTGDYFAQSCQGVLFHVLEEFCQHLGQLEITRDLLLEQTL